MNMDIREQRFGAQITDDVKELLTDHLHSHGLRSAAVDAEESSVIYAAYQDWVMISLQDDVGSEIASNYNSARFDIVGAYYKNKKIHSDCFHVHENYVEQLADDSDE